MISFKKNKVYYSVSYTDIIKFEGCGNYSKIYCLIDGVIVTGMIYGGLIKLKLPRAMFFRVNKRYVVNLLYIVKVWDLENNYIGAKDCYGAIYEFSRVKGYDFKRFIKMGKIVLGMQAQPFV